MRSSRVKKASMAMGAVLCLATAALAWLTAPSLWWMNPDFSQLHSELQTCRSQFAERHACDTARVMARQALDALRACLGDQADVDGCDAVRRTAARQAGSLQQLVHSASAEPATRIWLVLGIAFNPWMRAARVADWQIGSAWPWVLVALCGCGAIGLRLVYLLAGWRSREARIRVLLTDLDGLAHDGRQFERMVNWFEALHARLRSMQRARYAKLLLPWDGGASRGQGAALDLRTRLDQAFGVQPSSASGGLLGAPLAGDAAWNELSLPACHATASGVRRLLHVPTDLLLRVTCHRAEDLGGGSGFWEFSVQLDGVEAALPQRRPVELSADFLQSDWLARVQHDKIVANDWPTALVAAKEWLEGVLCGEVEVEGGTLSTHVERRLRDQLLGAQRARARKAAALRALREELGCGCPMWCLQRVLRHKPMVADIAFSVHDQSKRAAKSP